MHEDEAAADHIAPDRLGIGIVELLCGYRGWHFHYEQIAGQFTAYVRFGREQVLASEGYPEDPITGRELTGLDEAAAVPGVTLAHAATALVGERHVATGGRVLGVVAHGHDFTEARTRAYEAIGRIGLDGGHYRHDIAERVTRPAGSDTAS